MALADGGEGTVDALARPGTERRRTRVGDAYGGPVDADWLFDAERREAVIELASVAGHPVAARDGYDPDRASSAGVGELIRAAVAAGAQHVVVALGGSITVDAGAGALQAMGARFFDAAGAVLDRPAGRTLRHVARVDLAGLAPGGLRITVAADVDNPLCGEKGAAAVFGPQKGVRDVGAFDAALRHFDAVLAGALGRPPLADAPFAGAAGGALVGLAAIAPAEPRDGFALVAERRGLEAAVARADLVVTGEGSLDAQSLAGKGPVAIARMAAAAGRPVLAFAGRVAVDAATLRRHGISAAFAVSRGPASIEEAMAGAGDALAEVAAHAFSLIAAARAS